MGGVDAHWVVSISIMFKSVYTRWFVTILRLHLCSLKSLFLLKYIILGEDDNIFYRKHLYIFLYHSAFKCFLCGDVTTHSSFLIKRSFKCVLLDASHYEKKQRSGGLLSLCPSPFFFNFPVSWAHLSPQDRAGAWVWQRSQAVAVGGEVRVNTIEAGVTGSRLQSEGWGSPPSLLSSITGRWLWLRAVKTAATVGDSRGWGCLNARCMKRNNGSRFISSVSSQECDWSPEVMATTAEIMIMKSDARFLKGWRIDVTFVAVYFSDCLFRLQHFGLIHKKRFIFFFRFYCFFHNQSKTIGTELQFNRSNPKQVYSAADGQHSTPIPAAAQHVDESWVKWTSTCVKSALKCLNLQG